MSTTTATGSAVATWMSDDEARWQEERAARLAQWEALGISEETERARCIVAAEVASTRTEIVSVESELRAIPHRSRLAVSRGTAHMADFYAKREAELTARLAVARGRLAALTVGA